MKNKVLCEYCSKPTPKRVLSTYIKMWQNLPIWVEKNAEFVLKNKQVYTYIRCDYMSPGQTLEHEIHKSCTVNARSVFLFCPQRNVIHTFS